MDNWSLNRPEIQTGLFYIGLVCGGLWTARKIWYLACGIWIYFIYPLFASPPNWEMDYGEWAVVTGASDGLGKEWALQLARQGMHIILMSRSPHKLKAVADEIIRDHPVKVKIIPVNFSEATPYTYKKLEEQLREFDIGLLVNNVGVYVPYPKRFGDTDEGILWDHVSVNMGATTMMTRIILPHMQQRRRGGIINVSSTASLIPMPLVASYSASKKYMDYLSDSLKREYKRFGITVLNLNPLYIATNMTNFNERIGKPSLFVPTARQFVTSALRHFGVVDSAVGFWSHALQYGGIQFLPRFVFRWIVSEKHKLLKRESENKQGGT